MSGEESHKQRRVSNVRKLSVAPAPPELNAVSTQILANLQTMRRDNGRDGDPWTEVMDDAIDIVRDHVQFGSEDGEYRCVTRLRAILGDLAESDGIVHIGTVLRLLDEAPQAVPSKGGHHG